MTDQHMLCSRLWPMIVRHAMDWRHDLDLSKRRCKIEICMRAPSQAGDLSLQQGYVSTCVLVDDSLVADVLSSACKLQRAERFLGAHLAWADVCNDHCLGVSAQ